MMMQPQLTPKVPGAGPNVLIVDDSAMMRRFIKRVTSVADVPIGTVFEAADGCEALAILEHEDIRFVFTDINMPVMTGTELLRAMHERPEWQHIVRIIISADGSQARREEVAGLDVKMYVDKPLRPEVMRDVLSDLSSTTGR
jgi:CheY-like chemotaxis protein